MATIPDGEYASNFANGINDTGLPLLPNVGPSQTMAALRNPAAYGSIPGPTSPVSTSGPATTAAIAAGTQVNNQLPGYTGDLATTGENIASDLAGTVSPDVMAELQQQAGEEGISTGGATGPAYLKALGLTALGLEQTGQQDLQSILTSLPGAAISQNPAFQPTSAQTLEAAQNNAALAAAPNPYLSAQAGLAATQAGFGAGAGSGGGGRLPPTPSLNPFNFPSSTGTNPMNPFGDIGGDSGNAPGSPGAYTAWNAWNGTPTYPTSTTGTAAPGLTDAQMQQALAPEPLPVTAGDTSEEDENY